MKFYLWSSGLESWEKIQLTDLEQEFLIFSHEKQIKERTAYIFKDKLNRYILAFKNEE